MRLSTIDVNLLVALDALLQERQVTRAARRLGITQSAMSQSLQRLRELFEDPLLIRRGAVMVPSPFADGLRGPLREALRGLEATVSSRSRFDPATTERTFRLAAFDVYAINVVPRLSARLRESAPGASLRVEPLSMRDVVEQQRDGRVDVALLVPRASPVDLLVEPVIEESLVSMARTGHPILKSRQPTVDEFLRWPHVTFQITGEGPTAADERLAAQGRSRNVQVVVPYFLAAPAIVCSSDLIATVPRSAALAFREHWPVELFRSPLHPMTYVVHMSWPRHLEADDGNRWFRDQVRAATATLRGAPPLDTLL